MLFVGVLQYTGVRYEVINLHQTCTNFPVKLIRMFYDNSDKVVIVRLEKVLKPGKVINNKLHFVLSNSVEKI